MAAPSAEWTIVRRGRRSLRSGLFLHAPVCPCPRHAQCSQHASARPASRCSRSSSRSASPGRSLCRRHGHGAHLDSPPTATQPGGGARAGAAAMRAARRSSATTGWTSARPPTWPPATRPAAGSSAGRCSTTSNRDGDRDPGEADRARGVTGGQRHHRARQPSGRALRLVHEPGPTRGSPAARCRWAPSPSASRVSRPSRSCSPTAGARASRRSRRPVRDVRRLPATGHLARCSAPPNGTVGRCTRIATDVERPYKCTHDGPRGSRNPGFFRREPSVPRCSPLVGPSRATRGTALTMASPKKESVMTNGPRARRVARLHAAGSDDHRRDRRHPRVHRAPELRYFVTRSRITEATTALGDMRSQMEKCFMDNRTYLHGAGKCAIDATITDLTTATRVEQVHT